MDFIKLASQGYEAYEKAQGQGSVDKTGGEEYNKNPENDSGVPVDHHKAAQIASETAGGPENHELFSQALAFLNTSGDAHKASVDEDKVTDAHKKVYEDGDTSGLDAHSLGSAAALQVLKGYIGGDAPQTGHSADFQTKMIGMAMSEAAQMFEKTGGTASGDKQDAINGAATTMFKLFVQSKLSGGGSATTTGGGSNLSSLMSLASSLAK